jgi:hypothetical protein
MFHLAGLSGGDPRVRAVAHAWHSLSAVEKVECHIEELCRAAGISGADFVGHVSGTASELGIERRIKLNGEPGHADPLRTALGEELMKGHTPLPPLTWPPTAWNRCRDRLLAGWSRRASDEAAALRRRSRLSQSQFASLFMTSVRTVRRWEAGLSALTMHQQFFLRLFAEYIERNGVREFRCRFVSGAPRYGKAGRPAKAERSGL